MEPGADTSAVAPGAASGAAPSRSHPDWDTIRFDVTCARCGHDLRGLAEPICPQCRLEFEWSETVLGRLMCATCGYHLFGLSEPRCPECGDEFEWEAAHAEYQRRRQPFFETRWRDEPFRSMVRTWWLSLRPARLWRRLDIHDSPALGPLLAMIVISLALLFVTSVTLEGVRQTLQRMIWGWGRPGWVGGIATLMMFFAASTRSGYSPDLLATVVWWSVTTFAALMVFRQSMRRYKVCTIHVFRVWVYSMFLFPPLAVVIAYVPLCLGYLVGTYFVGDTITAIASLAAVCFATWSLYHGYRDYLRMEHGAAVAVASQVIAVLALLTLTMVAYRHGYDPLIVLDILNGVGLW